MQYLPINLNMRRKRAVFAGGGTPSSSKVRLVGKSDAEIVVIALRLNPDLQHFYRSGRIAWVKARPTPDNIAEFLTDAVMFYAATGDKALDAALANAAKPHVTLVNAVDQQSFSDFITPALIARDDVTIAVSTGGRAPVLARLLKKMIETVLPENIGRLARTAGAMRPQIEQRIAAPERRRFWQWFFQTHFTAPVIDDIDSVTNTFQRSAARHIQARVCVLLSGDHADSYALEALRDADAIYYRTSRPYLERLEHARREADIFPQKLPDIKALKQAAQCHQQIIVIAESRDLPKLVTRCAQAGVPLHLIGSEPEFALTLKTKKDLQIINWQFLRRGEIFVPQPLFADVHKALQNNGIYQHTPLYILHPENRKIIGVTLDALDAVPYHAVRIRLHRPAKIHALPKTLPMKNHETRHAQTL